MSEALVCYRQAVEMVPDCAEYQLGLAGVLERIGKLEEAIAAYRRVVALQADNSMAYGKLGWLLSQREEWQEAAVYLQKAVDVNPAMPLGIYEAWGKAIAASSQS
ncbi:tetratricopeptide repeat protein [Geitlerinema sp. PCC 9228]|jgi:tetratricopeptide (TPR) repeat protein|uniref:tetratricopeptide repeat protein n=1 Tax=Geitlerinema sp. PCC 9228 TaxID=111611 RepID=UPI0008F9CD2F|nr:tetratricopeptide repeat protein [Geitlerinema sp. PCC 9228]